MATNMGGSYQPIGRDAAEAQKRRAPPRSDDRGALWLRSGGPGVALLKAGKLVCGRDEAFCLVRNLAPDRLLAEAYSPVGSDCPVQVMLTDEVILAGAADWVGEARLEVRFDTPVDLAVLLPRLGKPESGHPARMPRVRVDAWARLRVGARVFSVRLCDVSQGGARVRVEGLQSPAAEAVLTIEGFRPVQSVVRWCGGSQAGLSFNQPLGFQELMLWLTRHRSAARGQRAAGAAF